jgi:NADH-quinone oxidoreductase subunit C
MRQFTPKDNVQKKAYFTDRFRIQPSIPKHKVETNETFQKQLEALKAYVEPLDTYIEANQWVIWIKPEENKQTLEAMKAIGYENLSELSAVDFIAQKQGFEVFYQLLSMCHHTRARVKCFVPQNETIQSVESVYKSANWAEREMYDMFGILIENHPYMKRILMPDDWHGHPLLKTYPLLGDEAAQWYEIDTLFGKEYRDVVGPEQRDPARVDLEDTTNFVRIRHEVPKGASYANTPIEQEYQEEEGVFGVKKVRKAQTKTLKERR